MNINLLTPKALFSQSDVCFPKREVLGVGARLFSLVELSSSKELIQNKPIVGDIIKLTWQFFA